MKQSVKINSLILLGAIVLFICTSCDKSEEFTLNEVESQEEDWNWKLNNVDDSTKALKGQTWKEWRKTFKDCMQADWIKSPFYFGPTSTVGLGSISSKDYKQLEWTLDKVFTEAEIDRLTNKGNPASCAIKRKIELDLETMLEGEVDGTGNANISYALSNAKSTTTTIDGFQVDNLVEGELKLILKDTEDQRKLAYKNALLDEKFVLLNRVIKVSGFTTEIELNNTMSADLEAELQNQPEISIGDAGIKVKFSMKNNTTITVKSLGDFIVFGKFVKAKKVKV